MKLTEKKLLSECGTELILDDGNGNPHDSYRVCIERGDYLIVEVGSIVGKPASKFKSPSITLSVPCIYEFKHYRSGGGKFWTSKAGISHYFIIPRDKVYLLPKEGYSYIHAEINGVKVSFNVSGGGGGSQGWCDYLNTHTQISVNHKLSDIKKIAEVAIHNNDIGATINPRKMDEQEVIRWQKMSDNASPTLKKQKQLILDKLENGEKVKIILKDGYKQKEGIGFKIHNRKTVQVNVSENSWRYEFTGAVKSILVEFDGMFNPCKVKVSQIDWVETCKALPLKEVAIIA
jgi:hypothetical protein